MNFKILPVEKFFHNKNNIPCCVLNSCIKIFYSGANMFLLFTIVLLPPPHYSFSTQKTPNSFPPKWLSHVYRKNRKKSEKPPFFSPTKWLLQQNNGKTSLKSRFFFGGGGRGAKSRNGLFKINGANCNSLYR